MAIDAPKYVTTTAPYTLVGTLLFEPGHEVTFEGWPPNGLKPINATAQAIADYFKRHRQEPGLPDTPLRDGKLNLPPLGTPMWRLGESYREIERANPGNEALRMIGPCVMGDNRPSSSAFTANRWPEGDVVPMNEPARIIAEFAAAHPSFPRSDYPKPWDEERHCLKEGIIEHVRGEAA